MGTLPQLSRHAPYHQLNRYNQQTQQEIMITSKLSPGLETGQDPMDSSMLPQQTVLREKLL